MNGVKVRSTLNGRRKVIDAVNIDKDNVLNRLSISSVRLLFTMSPMSAAKDTHYRRR